MASFVFPGQGSQQPGMGKFLYDNFKSAVQLFEEASDAVSVNFKRLCFEGSVEDLALTENTQPCLLLVSTATQQVVQAETGIKPQALAGHSIGEYAALVCADVMNFSDAIRAVKLRGQAMQAAVPVGQGGMAAVMGLDDKEVVELCKYAEQKSGFKPLSPANFNSPGQIVISGSKKPIEWLQANFKAEELWPGQNKRVKLVPLQVSAPFHCALMAPAEEKMRGFLTPLQFRNAKYPIVQNLTAKSHSEAKELKENIIRQITGPVRWSESMQFFKAQGWTQLIECGNGKVLSGLLKKIDGEAFKVSNVNSIEDLKALKN